MKRDRKIGRFIGLTVAICLISVVMIHGKSFAASAGPIFQKESGWYSESFELKIIPANGGKIYYTVDGSEPTVGETTTFSGDALTLTDINKNANVYSETDGMMYDYNKPYKPGVAGVLIQKATIVRAIEVVGGVTSPIVTKTYFVGTEQYGDLPVVSLVSDPTHLFSFDTGIYVTGKTFADFVAKGGLVNIPKSPWLWSANFTQKGQENWEKVSSFELFESKGSNKVLALSQSLGVRIQGNSTRMFNQKGLSLYGRKGINGSTCKTVEYQLIPGNTDVNGKAISSYKNFTLRGGGDDTEYTKIKDVWLQSLVKDRSISTQSSRPCILFLDGEFWGVYSLVEKYSENYMASHFGVNKDEVIIIKDGELDTDSVDLTQTDLKKTPEYKLYSRYLYWIGIGQEDYISGTTPQGMKKEANYQAWVAATDVQNYLDYYGTEIMIGNRDWPYSNELLWRTRTVDSKVPYADGKWRFALFDTDKSLGHWISDEAYNDELHVDSKGVNDSYKWDAVQNALDKSDMFKALMANTGFKNQFIVNLMDLYNKNFKDTVAIAAHKRFVSQIEPYMTENYARFGMIGMSKSEDRSVVMKQTYFDEQAARDESRYLQRYQWLPKYYADKFSLKDASNVTINTSMNDLAGIQVNTIKPDFSTGTWTGKYYSDYAIKLSAKPIKGYTFTGWSGSQGVTFSSSRGLTTSVSFPTGDVAIQANYVKGEAVAPTTAPKVTATPMVTAAPVVKPTSTPAPLVTVAAPEKVTLVSVKNPTKLAMKVVYNEVSGAAGYEIWYSKKVNFTGATKRLATGTSLNIKGLKKKTKYYVKVRAYKKNESKKVYGDFSCIKIITIKK